MTVQTAPTIEDYTMKCYKKVHSLTLFFELVVHGARAPGLVLGFQFSVLETQDFASRLGVPCSKN